MSNDNVNVFFDYAGGSLDVNFSGEDCATVIFFPDGRSSDDSICICDMRSGAGIDWESVSIFNKDGDIVDENEGKKEHEKLAKKYGIEALGKYIKLMHEKAENLLDDVYELKLRLESFKSKLIDELDKKDVKNG